MKSKYFLLQRVPVEAPQTKAWEFGVQGVGCVSVLAASRFERSVGDHAHLSPLGEETVDCACGAAALDGGAVDVATLMPSTNQADSRRFFAPPNPTPLQGHTTAAFKGSNHKIGSLPSAMCQDCSLGTNTSKQSLNCLYKKPEVSSGVYSTVEKVAKAWAANNTKFNFVKCCPTGSVYSVQKFIQRMAALDVGNQNRTSFTTWATANTSTSQNNSLEGNAHWREVLGDVVVQQPQLQSKEFAKSFHAALRAMGVKKDLAHAMPDQSHPALLDSLGLALDSVFNSKAVLHMMGAEVPLWHVARDLPAVGGLSWCAQNMAKALLDGDSLPPREAARVAALMKTVREFIPTLIPRTLPNSYFSDAMLRRLYEIWDKENTPLVGMHDNTLFKFELTKKLGQWTLKKTVHPDVSFYTSGSYLPLYTPKTLKSKLKGILGLPRGSGGPLSMSAMETRNAKCSSLTVPSSSRSSMKSFFVRNLPSNVTTSALPVMREQKPGTGIVGVTVASVGGGPRGAVGSSAEATLDDALNAASGVNSATVSAYVQHDEAFRRLHIAKYAQRSGVQGLAINDQNVRKELADNVSPSELLTALRNGENEYFEWVQNYMNDRKIDRHTEFGRTFRDDVTRLALTSVESFYQKTPVVAMPTDVSTLSSIASGTLAATHVQAILGGYHGYSPKCLKMLPALSFLMQECRRIVEDVVREGHYLRPEDALRALAVIEGLTFVKHLVSHLTNSSEQLTGLARNTLCAVAGGSRLKIGRPGDKPWWSNGDNFTQLAAVAAGDPFVGCSEAIVAYPQRVYTGIKQRALLKPAKHRCPAISLQQYGVDIGGFLSHQIYAQIRQALFGARKSCPKCLTESLASFEQGASPAKVLHLRKYVSRLMAATALNASVHIPPPSDWFDRNILLDDVAKMSVDEIIKEINNGEVEYFDWVEEYSVAKKRAGVPPADLERLEKYAISKALELVGGRNTAISDQTPKRVMQHIVSGVHGSTMGAEIWQGYKTGTPALNASFHPEYHSPATYLVKKAADLAKTPANLTGLSPAKAAQTFFLLDVVPLVLLEKAQDTPSSVVGVVRNAKGTLFGVMAAGQSPGSVLAGGVTVTAQRNTWEVTALA